MNLAAAAVDSVAGGMQALKLGSGRQQAAPRAEMPVRLEAAAAPGASDRLYALLMTQKADGSFRWSPVLEEWLGFAAAEIRRAFDQHGEALIATSIAVALLERDEATRQDEWRPAVRKARKWLRRPGAVAGFDVESALAGKPVVRV
ncbi:MAG: hypothetical protein V3T72_18230, partial [Thermoanaerobaculia bacterium]